MKIDEMMRDRKKEQASVAESKDAAAKLQQAAD